MTVIASPIPIFQIETTGLSRAQVLKGLRDFIQQEKDLTFRLHKEGATGSEVARRLAQLMDSVVAFAHHYGRENTQEDGPVVWIATGGYGRGELNPFSDVDLMLFHQGAVPSFVEHLVRTVIELLWDTGLGASHACRTPRDCFKVMKADPATASALLEGRYIAGEEALFKTFEQEVLIPHFSKRLASFVGGRFQEALARHRDLSPYLIEPNIKENPGGLRDIHLLFWIRRLAGLLPAQKGLLPLLKEEEYASLSRASDLLLRLRTQLHLLSGRRHDILERDLQNEVALALGYQEENGLPAATALMRKYFSSVAEVCYLFKSAQSRYETIRPTLAASPLQRRPMGPDLVTIGKKLYFSREDALTPWKAKKMMEVFFVAQRHHLEVSQQVLRQVHDHLWLVDEGFRNDPEVAKLFLGILEGTGQVSTVLSSMRDSGLLGQYIPEFGELVGFVHYDSYHSHTVDEHSLQAIRAVDAFWHEEKAERRRLLEETGRQALLRLALLIHDIGKPRGPQHPFLGATMVPHIAKRLSLSEQEARLLQFLVENHLEMALLFERRDAGEEPVLLAFAQKVGDLDTLKLLYLMTFADIQASGPWFAWQDTLLWELYKKTAIILSERTLARFPVAFKEEFLSLARAKGLEEQALRHCELVPPRYILEVDPQEAVIHLELIDGLKDAPLTLYVSEADHYMEVWICTSDRPARFSEVSGVFTALGLSIISAQAYTRRDGVIIDRFRVVAPEGTALTGEAELRRVFLSVLKGEKSLPEMLRSRQRRVVPGKRPFKKGPTRVYIDNKSSPEYTVVDVVSPDRVGLLYTISSCFANCGLDIHFAKVATKLDQAIDVFYVTNKDRRTKLYTEEEIQKVRRALIAACQSLDGK